MSDPKHPLRPLFDQWAKDSAAPAAPPAVSAETATPDGSASAPNHTLPSGLPPTETAIDLARAVAETLQRAELRALGLAVTCGELRASMLRAADMISRGNPGGAEAELRDALKVRP